MHFFECKQNLWKSLFSLASFGFIVQVFRAAVVGPWKMVLSSYDSVLEILLLQEFCLHVFTVYLWILLWFHSTGKIVIAMYYVR